MTANIDEKLSFIFRRRSIRAFTPQILTKETVQRLLEAAMAAPSAGACDPWRFFVVTNRELLMKIAKVLPSGKVLGGLGGATVGVVVCGDLEAAHDKQLSYLLQDCSAATQNLLLCAHVLGLGACWLGVHPREHRVKAIQEILSLQPSVIPVACVALGYPSETKEPRTRFNPNYVRFEN